MPRFINVTLGCDWEDCTNAGAEDEGTVVERTLSIDGKPPRKFLICKDHAEELDEIITPLLTAGVKVENGSKKNTTTTGETCKACGRTDLKNRAGMAQHVIRSHGFESLEAYEAEYETNLD